MELYLLFFLKTLLHTVIEARYAGHHLQFQKERRNYSFMENVILKNTLQWTHSQVKGSAFKTRLKSSLCRGTDKSTVFYIRVDTYICVLFILYTQIKHCLCRDEHQLRGLQSGSYIIERAVSVCLFVVPLLEKGETNFYEGNDGGFGELPGRFAVQKKKKRNKWRYM